MIGWPSEYDKYTTAGWYHGTNGDKVRQDGLHVSADAPPEVKAYFQKKIDFCKAQGIDGPDIVIH